MSVDKQRRKKPFNEDIFIVDFFECFI